MNPPVAPTVEQRIAATKRPQGRSPVMYQRWANLLFLHWKIAPEKIQETLPAGLFVDTYDGHAWLGVVPFFMQGVRPRFCPAVAGLSSFLELNLRTYVYDALGRPGVWFYSLDANQKLAVKIAQTLFSLPYVYAEIEASTNEQTGIDFRSTRPGESQQCYQYRKGKSIGSAKPGSLEYFLVERYILFSHRQRSNRLYIGQVHHEPYPLFTAEINGYSRALFGINGFTDPGREPDHTIMAPGVDVSIFGLKSVR